MPGLIPVSTVCDAPAAESSILATCERMIREQMPNLLRLGVNPHVAQACYCLTQIIAEAWPRSADANGYQVFLANSREEALSGAIKLARYAAHAQGSPATGLILDEDRRFEHFASTELAGLGRLEFIPGIEICDDVQTFVRRLTDLQAAVGFVVVPHALLNVSDHPDADQLAAAIATSQAIKIAHTGLSQLITPQMTTGRAPDIVVFDETFVNREVPFGAFAATKTLYRHWNRRRMTTFHSTTYQPNTISTLHLVNCLRAAAPDFIARHGSALDRIENDPRFRFAMFRDLYSRSLAKLAVAVGIEQSTMRASGHYVLTGEKRIFDGVAGVACSIRGHNPPAYVEELRQAGDLESCRDELTERLAGLTGLPHMVPAVSGASAVEHALKLGLASQYPRDYVLALRGGFGGKTLFALTGTWKSSLKAGLPLLYPNVVYVDPFAADAVTALEAAFRDYPIGIVQVELIQGVGGVRAVPPEVLQSLAELRQTSGCLLFVDEIQTGMCRTGPFIRSQAAGVQPDLVTIGKGTSDMMFPFAMTLYSSAIKQRLDERDCTLPEILRERFEYETGVQTVVATVRRADEDNLAEQVRERSELFARLLSEQLADCPLVRDVRCYGLLIGIELDAKRRPHRWLKKLVSQLYLLAMLDHPRFPLLVGFCQYDPNVLKLTPPLSITDEEIQSVCTTISEVLRRPLSRVATSGLMRMAIQPRLKGLQNRLSRQKNEEAIP